MPDLDELGLTEEATPEVDWDAPEQGQMPPQLGANKTFDFIFRLEEDPFGSIEVDGKKFLVINYAPEVVAEADGTPVADANGNPVKLRFQRASFYRSDKMRAANMNSLGGELLRSLGLRVDSGSRLTPQVVEQLVREADGRASFRAEVIWRAYFDATDTTVSTRPRASRGEIPWPRTADGKFELLATDPKTGEKQYGRVEINRFKLPGAA